MSRSHVAGRRGFTLVELLVVIGIIALLISILLPSLNRARDQARTVKCLSNLRQLGISMMMYANDHRVMVPAAHYPGGVMTKTWAHILIEGKYLTGVPQVGSMQDTPAVRYGRPVFGSGVLYCPEGKLDIAGSALLNNITSPTDPLGSVAWRVPNATDSRVTVAIANSMPMIDIWYGINGATQTKTGAATVDAADVDNLPTRTYPSGDGNNNGAEKDKKYTKVTAVKKSSETALLVDGFFMNFATNPYRISARHVARKYTNVLFCDGHAASVPRVALPAKTSPNDFALAQLNTERLSAVKWRIDQ